MLNLKILGFIKKADSIFSHKHRGAILSFVMFVAGWVVGLKISVIIGAYLILIAVPCFIYWALSENFVRYKIMWVLKPLPDRLKSRLYTYATLTLIILSVIIIGFPEWSNIISFLSPQSDLYVTQATANDHGQYYLLVQFGVKQPKAYDISIVSESIELQTNNNWSNVIEKWWGLPNLKSKSENAVYPFDSTIYAEANGTLWAGKLPDKGVLVGDKWITLIASNIQEDVSYNPKYLLFFNGVPISSSRSLYILFESDKPIRALWVMFDNTIFRVVGNKLIPY